jgi:hypothetical protein
MSHELALPLAVTDRKAVDLIHPARPRSSLQEFPSAISKSELHGYLILPINKASNGPADNK